MIQYAMLHELGGGGKGRAHRDVVCERDASERFILAHTVEMEEFLRRRRLLHFAVLDRSDTDENFVASRVLSAVGGIHAGQLRSLRRSSSSASALHTSFSMRPSSALRNCFLLSCSTSSSL